MSTLSPRAGTSELIDLVVPFKSVPDDTDDAELRYLLRTFEQNFAQLGRVFIVGTRLPRWLDPARVVHLPVEDNLKTWKDKVIIRKVLAACAAGVSRKFIRASDDMWLLRPSLPADFMPRSEGDMATWSIERWQQLLLDAEQWYLRLRHTGQVLYNRGHRVFNFDSHHPTLLDAIYFPRVMAEYDVEHAGPLGFTINTLYFNAIDTVPLERPDLFRLPGKLPPPGTRFWNSNVEKWWTPLVHPYLRQRYPQASRFERDAQRKHG